MHKILRDFEIQLFSYESLFLFSELEALSELGNL